MFLAARILVVVFFYVCSVFAESPLMNKIPRNIWQTYKSKDLSMDGIVAQETWVNLNPEFMYFLFDDRDIERYIGEKWSPEYLDFFHALPIGAMKADLWRYLVMVSDGGVYSDIDSLCLQPIRDWPLNGYISYPN